MSVFRARQGGSRHRLGRRLLRRPPLPLPPGQMSGPDMSMLSPRELRQRYGTPDDGRLNERVAASIARPGGGGRGGTEGRHMTERSGGGAVSLLRRRFDKVGDGAIF
eukprot:SAG31_NODE_335_length_17509_cov_7.127972_23_plen_107_part_00